MTLVPFLFDVEEGLISSTRTPLSNSAIFIIPSLTEKTENVSDNALTALHPTPFNPTDFLKALVSYFPPVFIFETTSTTFPNGIPLP